MRWFLGIFFCSLGYADFYYNYHPDLPARLGYGFSVVEPRNSFKRCLKPSLEVSIDGIGVLKSQLTLSSISSQKEFLNELSLSSSVSANSYFAKGSAGVEYLNDYQFKDNSLTWILSAKAHYGRFTLEDMQLLPFAEKLINDGDLVSFEEQCGSHIVDQIERGVSMFAVYSLKDLTQTQKEKFQSYLSISANNQVFSAELEASFKTLLLEASKTSHLDLRIFTMGGEGLKRFSKLPAQMGDLNEIKNILGSYLETMDVEHSAILRYHVNPMKMLGVKQSPMSYYRRDRVLEDYFFRIQSYDPQKEELESIIDKKSKKYPYLSKEQEKSYQESYRKLCAYLDKLEAEAQSCLKDSSTCQALPNEKQYFVDEWPEGRDCRLTEGVSRVSLIEPTPSTFHKVWVEEECEIYRKYAYDSGCLTKRELVELQKKKGIPVCGFSVGMMTWTSCP